MLVVDASVALEILIRTALGARFEERVVQEDVHAPHLIDLEFTNALRRLTYSGGLSARRAEEALDAMQDWRLVRHEHTNLLSRVWEMRDSLSAYDACYVALAETLNAPLVTLDARLSRSHGHRANIELLS